MASEAAEGAVEGGFPEVVAKAEEFVRRELAANDASHDFAHIERVRNTTRRLATEEAVPDVELCELAALLHDIADYKYSGSETAGGEAALKFLLEAGYPEDKSKKVKMIVDNVSFRKELRDGVKVTDPSLAVVQDADRLDAIGAIGIARCFTFGGAKHRALWNPTEGARSTAELKRSYGAASDDTSSVAHFHEKLLKLKDMMKTDAGRRTAEKRHKVMEDYLASFEAEWFGEA